MGALGLPVAVQAAPILKLTSGATTVTVNDNGPGDTDVRPNYISFNGAVGTLAATLSASGNSNSPGGVFPNSPSQSLGILQLQTLEVRNNTTGRQALDIVFSDNGFITALGNANQLSSSVGLTLTNATLGDSVSFQATWTATTFRRPSTPSSPPARRPPSPTACSRRSPTTARTPSACPGARRPIRCSP